MKMMGYVLQMFFCTLMIHTTVVTTVALGAAKTAKYEAPAAKTANYEAPSDKRASEVLSPNLRSGPHFKVQDRVAADGYMLRFTVTSD